MTSILFSYSDLEWERTINSVTLSKEKEILRKIIKLEKLKHDIHAYESHDKQVKEQKVRARILELDRCFVCASSRLIR